MPIIVCHLYKPHDHVLVPDNRIGLDIVLTRRAADWIGQPDEPKPVKTLAAFIQNERLG